MQHSVNVHCFMSYYVLCRGYTAYPAIFNINRLQGKFSNLAVLVQFN